MLLLQDQGAYVGSGEDFLWGGGVAVQLTWRMKMERLQLSQDKNN